MREAGYDVIEVGREEVTILGGPALPADAKVVFFGAPVSTLKTPSAQVGVHRPVLIYLVCCMWCAVRGVLYVVCCMWCPLC